jgi:predicted AAA+ superfamily ATPase
VKSRLKPIDVAQRLSDLASPPGNRLEALKKVYLLFTLPPWTATLSRSILREEKAYFWDWGIVNDPGGRFENFIAVCLERTTAAWNEWGKGSFRLHYLRTKEGREVDFVISEKNKPLLLVEAKRSETDLSPHLGYFQKILRIPYAFQVINQAGICQEREKGRYLIGADRFLSLMA